MDKTMVKAAKSDLKMEKKSHKVMKKIGQVIKAVETTKQATSLPKVPAPKLVV